MNATLANERYLPERAVASPMGWVRATGRAIGLCTVGSCALVHALFSGLAKKTTSAADAQRRALWLHRWSRVAAKVLGLGVERQGPTPVSGVVIAQQSSLLDLVLLAAITPCVFVVGAEVRRWPVLGLFARLAGMLFVDRRRRNDVVWVNSLIRQSVQRRQLVVLFLECGANDRTGVNTASSALFQPAVELGCTLTAAAIHYESSPERHVDGVLHSAARSSVLGELARLVTQPRVRAAIAFGGPKFRRGDRKTLARDLRAEVLELQPFCQPADC